MTTKIGMYNMNMNELIKTFDSIEEACEYTDMSKTYLLNTLSGKEDSAAGFYWRYIEEGE